MCECCLGHDTESREKQYKIAKILLNYLPDGKYDINDPTTYDVSDLLDLLYDDEHAEVFEAFLNLF